MKTSNQFNIPLHAKAGSNLIGGILLFSLLSTALLSVNVGAYSDLFLAFKSQWLNLSKAMSGFTAQVHPAQW